MDVSLSGGDVPTLGIGKILFPKITGLGKPQLVSSGQ